MEDVTSDDTNESTKRSNSGLDNEHKRELLIALGAGCGLATPWVAMWGPIWAVTLLVVMAFVFPILAAFTYPSIDALVSDWRPAVEELNR